MNWNLRMSEMRPTSTYKLGYIIISKEKEEKKYIWKWLNRIIHHQSNIDKIFGDTFKMPRNI